jgi:type VI secretion system secreted protein VgrG
MPTAIQSAPTAIGFQQTNLPIQITTPLGANKLLVRDYAGEESISGLFHYRVSMVSEDPLLPFESIVGKAVTLQIPQSSGDTHYINGIVGTFSQHGRDQRFVHYTAELHPWLWLLTMNVDCQIFQNMSTPDIVKKVFADLGFSDFKDQLKGAYLPREFCVQYRESSFAFISRLLEEEGIYYFFEHTSSSHALILADDPAAWLTCAGLTAAIYNDRPDSYNEDDLITECEWRGTVTPGQFKTDDYNFETPDTDLLATAQGKDTTRSIYGYPGLYRKQSEGEHIANLRLAALELPAQTLLGTGTCRSFYAGSKFTLSEHYAKDRNRAYIVHKLKIKGDQRDYQNSFEAFPAATLFRPPLLTPHPVISGTQTALVVGKSGEEIWTEIYGRVKVKFNWDQSAASDETASCWVRVASPWAGKQWGGIHVPRLGMEVIVSFLEGNPDRPLITGSVYNASQTVPNALPVSQTKSTLRSNSSKGGNGSNEFTFEDKAGAEEVFLHAQKDLTVAVLNNMASSITKDESLVVKGKRTVSITGDEAHTNSANYTSSVSGNFTLKVDGNLSIKASGTVSIESGSAFSNKAGTSLTNQAGEGLTNKAGTSLTEQAGTTLSIKAGASGTIDGGGTLALKGGMVKLN